MLRSRQSFLPIAGLLLGILGIAVCLAATTMMWKVSSRLGRAAENVFGKIDGSFVVVRQRVADTRDRVEESKIRAKGIEQSLKDWSKSQVGDRLEFRLNAVERTERLMSALQQANHWLEVSESSVQLVQQTLSMVRSTGAPVDLTSVDRLIEEVVSLRIQVAETMEFVARIQERTAEASDEKSVQEQVAQAVQLALRVVATLGSIDFRLVTLEARLSECQDNLHGLKTRTRRWILVVTIGITLLVVWMAAGQWSLCVYGWKGWHRR